MNHVILPDGSRKGSILSRAQISAFVGVLAVACALPASAQNAEPSRATKTQAAQSQATSPPPKRTADANTVTLKRRVVSLAQIPGAEDEDSALTLLIGSPTFLPPLVPLEIDAGTPLRMALKKPLPVKKVGEPVRAYVTEPLYAFDRIVVPEGTEVDGHIDELTPPSKLRRAGNYLNADFSAHRTVHISFDSLLLKDGTRIPIETKVLSDVGPVVRLEANPQGKNSAARRARGLISRQWHQAMGMLKPSALWQQAKLFLWNEMPYHKQKLAAGTVFDVELEQPLHFGSALVAPTELGSVGRLPTVNEEAFARLSTPLDSATAHVGAPVEAFLTRPVFSSDRKLLLPVGTALQGMVVRARPARKLHRNGLLHFTMQRVKLPSSMPEPIEMALAGIEVPKSSHIKLDSEGETSIESGTERRLLTTALSVAIASSSLDADHEHHSVDPNGDAGNRAVAGGSGYRLIGFALGFGVQSRVFAQVTGFLGAGESIYFHFLARGSNLVLPKDTPIAVSFGGHRHPAGT